MNFDELKINFKNINIGYRKARCIGTLKFSLVFIKFSLRLILKYLGSFRMNFDLQKYDIVYNPKKFI